MTIALDEARPAPGSRVLLVTGRLARPGLERVMQSIDPQDFSYEITLVDVQVAAWITTSMIEETLEDVSGYDLVLVPGKVQGDVEALSKTLGVQVLRGPECYSELPVFFEEVGLEQIGDEDLVKPKIALIGTDADLLEAAATFIGETYRIPVIRIEELLVAAVDAEGPFEAPIRDARRHNTPVPHNVLAELLRVRFLDDDVRRGYVLQAYPQTEREVRWMRDLKLSPDIVLALDTPVDTKGFDDVFARSRENFEAAMAALVTDPGFKRLSIEGDTQTVIGEALAAVEAMMQQCLRPDDGLAVDK